MSRFRRRAVWLAAFSPLLMAQECGTPGFTLPSHIRSVAVATFENRTREEGLEQEVMRRVYQALVTTSEVSVVPDPAEADGVIRGVITRYERTPVSWDQTNRVVQYKIRIVADVTFEDRVRGGVVWRVPEIDGVTTYSLVRSPPETEDVGIIRAAEEMARDILFMMIEGRQDTSDDLLFEGENLETVGAQRR